MNVTDIIERYEVPKELWDAIFEAYIEGSKHGFIQGAISEVTK